ncbi:OmpA family protein [Exilibacterium tricleocarpae]|uniref:OmpA family protein n=1 Tax=Exilibacterium tricleocarpae TaxID=2591008 RepID=A0A545TVP1_9GAMM|nr:OmpA family protein [Exilibacterium tricleocarpae]TQV81221.1 OmpA family protein [Exilibacterium tricleocarpae]
MGKTIMTSNPFATGLLLLFLSSAAAADSSAMRASLFSEADKIYSTAKDARADILAPRSYGEATKLYQKAEGRLKRGQSIERIRQDLDRAIEYFNTAVEATRLADVTFTTAVQARNNAEAAQANDYAKDSWKEAEEQFATAARALESGNVNRARKYADTAEATYRDAELAAIKVNYLSEARKLIASAKKAKVDRLAPKTLSKAQALLKDAEAKLSASRYDTDEPRLLAKQAKYEAKHAIYIADIVTDLRSKKISPEDLILQSENPVVEIASALDLVAEFDEGLAPPTEQIRQEIGKLRQQAFELAERQNQILALETEMQSMEQKLGVQSQRLEKQEQHRQRLRQVESLFSPSEAIVLSQGDNVVIRTIGLNFGSGSANIESQYFGLLKKVQQALRQYPNGTVVVEGHTDSFGSDAQNLVLSKKRAEAVRDYLLANRPSDVTGRIDAVGYGESRPIGNNETPEGRVKNRRIDLLLIPKV